MDKDIENMAKSRKSCASVVKAPPIKFNPWPKTEKPWSRLHIDYVSHNKRNIHFCHSRQFYEMARSFQMQNADDKNHKKGVTGTVFMIRIARNLCI